MKTRDAIKVLMLSPLYFRLDLPARKALILEFIAIYNGTFERVVKGRETSVQCSVLP